MLHNILLICTIFFSLNFLQGKEQFIIRPQTKEEALDYIKDLISNLTWFKKNGYTVSLPVHPDLTHIYEKEKPLSGEDIEHLKTIFFDQIYQPTSFNLSLQKIHESESIIEKGLEKLAELKKNWDFKLMETYEVILTLYGPGGDYNSQKGTVTLFTTSNGTFKRNHHYEVLLHEIVHIGIEECVVKKYHLSHWEKERLVDLICSLYLEDLLPEYKMQPKGDKQIDTFVSKEAIYHDLPSAVNKYITR